MKKNTINSKWRNLVDALLEDDKQLIFEMKGYSMFPTLRPGDKGVVQKCSYRDLRRGDIAVFYQDNSLVAHRLVHRRSDLLLTKGDHNTFFDPPVTPERLVGKLVRFERNSKIMDIDAPIMKRIAWFTIHFRRFSTFLNRLLMRTGTLKSAGHRYIHDFRTSFDFAIASVKGLFALNSTVAVVQGLIPFVVILLVKWLIDLLNAMPGQERMPPLFVLLLVLTGLAFLMSSVLAELKGWLSEKLSQGVTRRMYDRLHHRYSEFELSHFENPKELDKMHRAVQEASFRPVKLLNEVQHLLKSVAASLFLVGIFLSIRWYLVLILLVAIVPGVLLKIRFARRYHHLKEKLSPLERRMYYFNRVLTGYPFAKEIRLFGFARFFVRHFKSLQASVFEERLKLRRNEMVQNMVAQVFAVFLIFSTLALVAHWMVAGLLSIGTVVMFFFAFQRGYAVLNDLFKSMASLLEDTIFMNDLLLMIHKDADPVALNKIADTLSHDLQGTVTMPTNPLSNDAPVSSDLTPRYFSLQEAISIENLSFRYVNSKRDALQEVNLTIPAGSTVAVVGANGSGKTTLVKLLAGFYLPDSGTIYYDGISTAELGREVICKNLSAVFQDFALYNVTANDNIALGDIHHSFSAEKVKHAAQQAGISEVLEQLPNGFSTLLGNQFMEGEELSIGQWQKLAIARAFYRDSPLLLMDEPSSALDAVSEQQIIDTLKTLAHRKTAVVISHRLSTVKWVDRIIVLDKGRVAEEGTHDELMVYNGRYAHLYREATKNI
jgi:ATP-binding cassette subfamily B protein